MRFADTELALTPSRAARAGASAALGRCPFHAAGEAPPVASPACAAERRPVSADPLPTVSGWWAFSIEARQVEARA